MSLTGSFSVAPEKVTLSGRSKVLSGSVVSLECVSAPSVPATTLTWGVTQSAERLNFSPDENVEQLEDGSFVTSAILEVVAGKGHDLVVECYGTNDVMGGDFQAFAHVVDILSKYLFKGYGKGSMKSSNFQLFFFRSARSTQNIWSVRKCCCTKLDMFHLSWEPSGKPLLV